MDGEGTGLKRWTQTVQSTDPRVKNVSPPANAAHAQRAGRRRIARAAKSAAQPAYPRLLTQTSKKGMDAPGVRRMVDARYSATRLPVTTIRRRTRRGTLTKPA